MIHLQDTNYCVQAKADRFVSNDVVWPWGTLWCFRSKNIFLSNSHLIYYKSINDSLIYSDTCGYFLYDQTELKKNLQVSNRLQELSRLSLVGQTNGLTPNSHHWVTHCSCVKLIKLSKCNRSKNCLLVTDFAYKVGFVESILLSKWISFFFIFTFW